MAQKRTEGKEQTKLNEKTKKFNIINFKQKNKPRKPKYFPEPTK